MLGTTNGPETFAHNLFDLKSANEGKILLTRYFEIYIGFWGLKIPHFF